MTKKHMNNKIISTTLALTLALILSIGLSYVGAAWSEPRGGVSSDAVGVPVNQLSVSQIKNGGLSVDKFIAMKNSKFSQKSFLNDTVYGGTAISPRTLLIGGTDSNANTNPDLELPSEYTVDTRVSGFARANSTLGAEELSTDKKFRLCADDTGHIVFCQKGVYQRRITGVISGSGAHAIRVKLDEPAPSDLTLQISSYYDDHGRKRYDQEVRIASGKTDGSTVPLPGRLSVYECTIPVYSPDIYYAEVNGIIFELRIENSC